MVERGCAIPEFALVVSDEWQRQGLGAQLLRTLIRVGRNEKLERITATILSDNHEMQHVARRLGLSVQSDPETHDYRAELKL